jgi:hypothetical protein
MVVLQPGSSIALLECALSPLRWPILARELWAYLWERRSWQGVLWMTWSDLHRQHLREPRIALRSLRATALHIEQFPLRNNVAVGR